MNSSKNPTQNNDQEKVISIIKSCIASVKETLTVDQLYRDYKQLVGSPIPFKEFNHGTLVSFLQSFPKIVKVFNSGGQTFVKAVPNEQTSHIENLIRGQKKSKSKGSFSKPKNIRRPIRSGWVPPSSYTYRSQFRSGHKTLLPTPSVPYHSSNFRPYSYGTLPPPPPKRTSNFSVSGNYYVPRSTTTKYNAIPNMEKMKLNNVKQDPAPVVQEKKPPPQLSYRAEVEKEAKKRGISEVQYITLPCGKKNTYWLCNLTIGDKIYRSYPEGKTSSREAEEYVSKLALESLKGVAGSSSRPVTKDFDLASDRIKKVLANESDIVWWEHVRERYAEQYGEIVEYSWVEEASSKGVEGISFDSPTKGCWILSLKKEDTKALVNGITSSSASGELQNSLNQPEPLKLPEDKMWNVVVNYVKDCSEVWFRLIGEEYSEAFEELVTNMELHYLSNEKRSVATSLTVDGYYAFPHEASVFRVQLVSLQGDDATVFFIDYGDNEVVSASLLYDLEPKFLKLPCQSINSSLAGFEIGVDDPVILFQVQNLVLGKPLVADVLERENHISVVLYDTSTSEDININEKILQMLNKAYPEPQFPPKGGVCEVYVSHVTPDGDIYVIVESSSFKELQDLLASAKARAAELLGEEQLSVDVGKLYLAKYSVDGKWHRTRALSREINGKVLLEALDTGAQMRVPSANIVPLEKVAPFLCKIPPQSLRCRLYNVPSARGLKWTQKTSERLLAILPRRSDPMLLKVTEIQEDKPTLVELFQRVEHQNLLASINASLDLDSSLFSNEDKNNNLQEAGKAVAPLSNDSKQSKLPSPSLKIKEEMPLNDICLPTLPDLNSYFDVYVTYAASPSNFAVQSWKNTIKLEWLMGEMKSFYSNPANRTTVKDIRPGGFYALLHDDGSWYRVQIDNVFGDLVSGVFIDYGDCFCSSLENVQPLWQNFKNLSYQAFKAKLGGIAPNHIDWTPEDTLRFRELVENREFVSFVTEILSSDEKQKTPTLVLYLFNTKDPEVDVNIGDLLVEEKRARKCK